MKVTRQPDEGSAGEPGARPQGAPPRAEPGADEG